MKKFNLSVLILLSLLFNKSACGMEQISKSELKEPDSDKNSQNKHSFLYKPSNEQKRMLKEKITECHIDEVHEVMDQEKNTDAYSTRTNVLLLVGIPGVGKTTIAKAIACELGDCYFVNSGDLLKEHRNGTSEQLKEIVNSISREQGKKILVLDEINKLLENYTSEYKDASETASTLWEIMDAQKDNLDFFLIATANESKKLPVQIQDRFGMSVIGIEQPTNQERRKLILELLSRVKMQKHKLLDQYVDRLVELTQNYTPRDLLHIIGAVEKRAFLYNEQNPVLSPEIFEEILQLRNVKFQTFWNKTVPLSDEERRHQEKLRKNREVHDHSINLQRELHDTNSRLQRTHHGENINSQRRLNIENLGAQRQMHNESIQIQNGQHAEGMRVQQQQHQDNIDLQIKLAQLNGLQQTIASGRSTYWKRAEDPNDDNNKYHHINSAIRTMYEYFNQIFPNQWFLRDTAVKCNCNDCSKQTGNENNCTMQ